jgi:2-alkenal reductase
MLLVGALVGGTVGGAVGVGLAGRAGLDGTRPGEPFVGLPTPTAVATGGPPGGAAAESLVVEAVRELAPAVVTVVQRSGSRDVGSGSGFIIDLRGYIATNSHVVSTPQGAAGAGFEVIFADDTRVPARLVGRDPETDVAVVQIDPGGRSLKLATLGDSDEIPVGATVVAIGSALGDFRNSVTVGVLSGKGRRFPEVNSQIFLEDLLQTDAPISPGNSGGPLIWASRKQVIGMNTLVVRETGSEGLGFAVSSKTVREIAEELIRSGRVERGLIGIGYQLNPRASGVLITQVQAGSPGAQAGLRQGDVLTKVNDQVIDAEHPLKTIMLRFRPGDRVRLTVVRDGREQQVEVTLGR